MTQMTQMKENNLRHLRAIFKGDEHARRRFIE